MTWECRHSFQNIKNYEKKSTDEKKNWRFRCLITTGVFPALCMLEMNLSKTFIHQKGWLQKRIRPEDNYWWWKRIVSLPLCLLRQQRVKRLSSLEKSRLLDFHLKTMFRLPELNIYTSTVNIGKFLVKPCKISFFKIFSNNWRGFSFRVVSRISLLILFYHSLSLYYSLKVHISINLLLRAMLFSSPYDDGVTKK